MVRHGYAIARMRLVQPSGWQCALLFSPRFFLPLALALLSLSLFLSPSLSFCSDRSLFFCCTLQRSSALGSMPVSKLLVLLTILSDFSLFVAFRHQISDSPLNNRLLREGLKGCAFEEPIESKKVRNCIVACEGIFFYGHSGSLCRFRGDYNKLYRIYQQDVLI